MIEWIAIIHLKDKHYLIDRQAYYLLCNMQQIKFGFEDGVPRGDEEKEKMFQLILDWLVDNQTAIKLSCRPHHLIIKFEDE